jgi:TolB-like protein/Flp pilus assembly protein TadD
VDLSAWLQEFKRRRVFRALAGYGLISFALLQVAEPVIHGLNLPDWTLKALVIGLGLGFPLTVLLAWAYDFKVTGIERTPSIGGGGGRGWRTVALIAIGLLLATPGVAWFLLRQGRSGGAATTDAGEGPSVAVLPFVNMSGDPENEFFSDGLSEEILNALAQVPGLRVPARTSSFAFKGKTQDVVRIAEALRVSTVLEGSVRKAGSRVRITAQLIKAVDGYHLWSQTFDRELKDVFAVQEEISLAIAGALKLQLAPPTAGGTRKATPTTNPEAYEAYLKGRQALNERTRASIERSIVQFQRATALDPAYAQAWADTAVAVMLLVKSNSAYGETPLGEALARARPLLQKAMALAPDHPGVLAAAGFIESGDHQPQRGIEYFDRALALNPANGEVRNWRKIALAQLGHHDQVLPAAVDAVRSDPLSRIALFNELVELQRYGRDAELGPAMERLQGLDEGWGLWAAGQVAMGRGDRAAAVRHLLPALQMGREKTARSLSSALVDLGLRDEALLVSQAAPLTTDLELREFARALEPARAGSQRDPSNPEARTPLFLALYGLGRSAEAATEAAQLNRDRKSSELFPTLMLLMADAARSAGQAADAAAWRDQAGKQIEAMRRGGYAARITDIFEARLLAYDGRDGEAVALLDRAAPTFPFPRSELEWPIYARLQRRPDFQAALKKLDGALAAQRVEVVALLCGPKRLSDTWQPAPATCAGSTTPR